MTPSRSPTVRRRRLAAELRRLRGVRTGSAVARALGWSPAKISRFELGQTTFPLNEVEKLLDLYGVTGDRRGHLLDLAQEASMRGWWEDYADALPEEYMEFIGLEAEASDVSLWQLGVIPGILQTEDYARKIHLDYQRVIPTPPGVIERRIKVRMHRQEVLTGREPPLRLSAVLDEATLLRKVGGDEVMHAQLEHLVRIGNLPNVDLRILPFGARDAPLNNPFVIFSFLAQEPPGATTILHDVVCTENVKSQLYVEGEADTYSFRLVFAGLREVALTQADSRRFIQETADRIWRRQLYAR